MLWDRLDDFHLGQSQLDTVPSGSLERLPDMVAHLVAGEADGVLPPVNGRRRPSVAIAYPLLLQLAGVRRLRGADFWRARTEPDQAGLIAPPGAGDPPNGFRTRLADLVATNYAVADAVATEAGRRFRSAYVSNFILAALAVLISLTGNVLPVEAKPLLVCLELATTAVILILTRLGNRPGWYRLWLDGRRVAEQLRCLAIAAQLGDLRLRGNLHPAARAVSRRFGLPSAIADAPYLARVHVASSASSTARSAISTATRGRCTGPSIGCTASPDCCSA